MKIHDIKRKALPAGTLIEYCGEQGRVVQDKGGEDIQVEADGFLQRWWWTLDGVSCSVVSLPPTENEQ